MSSLDGPSGQGVDALAYARRPGLRQLVLLTALTAVGAVLGAVVMAVTSSNTYTAVSTVQLSAPPDINALLFGDSSNALDVDAIVASQIAVLQGDELGAVVARELGVASGRLTSYTVSQVGSAPLLEIATTSETLGEAERVTDSVANTYVRQRRSQVGAELDSAVANLNNSIAAQGQSDVALRTARSRVTLARQQVDTVASVLVPAQIEPAGLLSSRAGRVLLGGSGGALLALLLALALRNRQRGVLAQDLGRIPAVVLEPELSGRRSGPLSLRFTDRQWVRQAGLLVNQLDPHAQWIVAGFSRSSSAHRFAGLLARRVSVMGGPEPILIEDVARPQALDTVRTLPPNGGRCHGILLVSARSTGAPDVVGAVNVLRGLGADEVSIILSREETSAMSGGSDG